MSNADDDVTLTPPARKLSQLIAYLDQDFDGAAGQEVQDLIATLEDVAAEGLRKVKGAITLKLSIIREDGTYEIKPELKVTAPAKPVQRTFMWADRDNNLTPENPKQMKFRFRQVEDARSTRVVTDA
ncbi:hypothetical protein FHP25_36045 [Vineibacter terrae]|uniref:Uncharacterized protein n=1 Tax=Vineibacter terrae TaxID=2586908 RepID=A0A5C8P8P8_9HYPH|nr:hypothetical protein [Vineibacter terrae]TXL70137.1 hypothetical protein FHP25_36045 [Vineibacter terrae]